MFFNWVTWMAEQLDCPILGGGRPKEYVASNSNNGRYTDVGGGRKIPFVTASVTTRMYFQDGPLFRNAEASGQDGSGERVCRHSRH